MTPGAACETAEPHAAHPAKLQAADVAARFREPALQYAPPGPARGRRYPTGVPGGDDMCVQAAGPHMSNLPCPPSVQLIGFRLKLTVLTVGLIIMTGGEDEEGRGRRRASGVPNAGWR